MDAAKTSRNTVLILSQNAIQFGVGLLFFTIAAKLLTTADIGLISTFTFISVLFASIAPLSLQVAATRFMAESLGQNNPEKASSVAKTVRKLVLSISLGFLIICSTAILLFLTGYLVMPDLVVLVLVYGFLSTIRIMYQHFLQGLQKFERFALTGIISISLSRGLGLFLVFLNYGLLGIILGWIIGEAAGFLLGVFFYKGQLPEAKTSYDYRPLIAFSLPVLVMTIANTISEWIDRIFLFTDLEKLGVYELVIRGSSTLALIWLAVSTTLLPLFSGSYGRSGSRDMAKLSKLSIKYMMYFIAPASFGLAAISKSAMALLFGWEYTGGSVALSILALFSIFTSLGIIASIMLQAIGKTGVFLKITLATIAVDLAASVVLVPRLGINGAAVSRATMMITGFILNFYELRREVTVEIDRKAMSKTFTAALIMALPLVIFDTFYSGIVIKNAAVGVTIEILLGISIYGAMILLLKALNKQDLELLVRVFPKPISRIINRFEGYFA